MRTSKHCFNNASKVRIRTSNGETESWLVDMADRRWVGKLLIVLVLFLVCFPPTLMILQYLRMPEEWLASIIVMYVLHLASAVLNGIWFVAVVLSHLSSFMSMADAEQNHGVVSRIEYSAARKWLLGIGVPILALCLSAANVVLLSAPLDGTAVIFIWVLLGLYLLWRYSYFTSSARMEAVTLSEDRMQGEE